MHRKPTSRTLALSVALLGLLATAWVALSSRAQGDPPGDDGVPSGTVAFFGGGACPAGWTTATEVQGRLVVAVADGAKAGVVVGTPLADQEDRRHQHTYSGSVQLDLKNVNAGDGGTYNSAAPQGYTVSGSTDKAASALPFVQVQPCVKK